MRRFVTLDLARLSGYAALVTGVFALILIASLRTPWPVLAEAMPLFAVYAVIVSGISWLVVPPVAKRTGFAGPFVRWPLVLLALLFTGTVGAAIASAVAYFGLGMRREFGVVNLFRNSLHTALPVTLMAGVITTVVQAGRERLKANELALQTQRAERERAEKLAAEAQLASLASRVQPHFLFNTLNSIAALIREDPRQAERTVEQLASLLRSSLDVSPTVTLDQELKLVRDYLEIQKIRLGTRLVVDLALQSGISASLPPFSIQTLVENCLKHAAPQRPDGVEIQVQTLLKGNVVVIRVTDNGPGFDPDAMRLGGGLDNLQKRLLMIHGARAVLQFTRERGGMTVSLSLPLEPNST